MKSKILGLIPARGGSKGIPRKNITNLAGKPLISYAIEALKKSEHINRVIVTTDNEEIAEVAKKNGAEIPFMRPPELATDTSSVLDALAYTVNRLDSEEGYRPDYVVTIQPTSPLVTAEQIDKGIGLIKEKNADSVISATELPYKHHPFNIREVVDGRRAKFWKENEHYQTTNRQQRKTFYVFGNVYISNFDLLARQKKLEGKNNYLFLVDPITTLDIDNVEDLKFIEFIIKNCNKINKKQHAFNC